MKTESVEQIQRDLRDIQMRRALFRFLHDRMEAGKKHPRPYGDLGDERVAEELRRILGGPPQAELIERMTNWMVCLFFGSVALLVMAVVIRVALWIVGVPLL